eukprot:780680-Amphidinium_carterae.1
MAAKISLHNVLSQSSPLHVPWATWNSNGLMHTDARSLHQRLGMLNRLLTGHRLVFLQEIHDTYGLDDLAGERFWVSWSRHPSAPRSGGVATFLHKELSLEAPDFVVVVEGRVLAAHFQIGTFPVCFLNCHITPDA